MVGEDLESKPSGGGRGFLFGNIDRRGRLDKDCMEEEAKDQLDNVGTQVRDVQDESIQKIVVAVPKRHVNGGEDDRSDVEHSLTEHQEGAEGFCDEDEVMELDERERAMLATMVLDVAAGNSTAAGDDDDESYDDDDDDNVWGEKSTAKAPMLAVPALTPA